MKLNKILMALAATAIVGCTSDDLNDFSAKQAPEDSRMIELDQNFVIAGVGAEGSITRTHWEQDPDTKGLVNKFLPIWETTHTGGLISDYANLEAQAVGLCWLGQTPGAEVYTNYQFYHWGWLKKGETEADVDNCDPFKLYNGALYDEINASSGTADEEADETTFSIVPTEKAAWELNYNSGVYKTENKTIFGGQYIVYYPYNPEFQETGTIPAVAKTSFDWDMTNDDYDAAWLGEATFRYSAPVTIQGGMNAANFGLYNLSTLVRLRVFTATAADAYNGDEIDKVVLYSESGKFVKQANLAADKIAAGKQGQELYAATEPAKTVTVNFTASLPDLDTKKNTEVSAYFTVLPTTVDDLVALVHNADQNFWYRVELPAAEFKAGSAKVIDVTVKEANITTDYVVVDQASLVQALGEAELEATESNPITITLIGDVVIESPMTIDQAADRYITIDGGDIIVPENSSLTIETLKEVKSNIRVLGSSCCSGYDGGRLIVSGTDPEKDVTTLNNVILEATEARTTPLTYDALSPELRFEGYAENIVAEGATVKVEGGNVNVEEAVAFKGGIEIAEDAKLTVAETNGEINFFGSDIVNNGTIEVKKDAHFDITDKDGNASWDDGQKMINNGSFIHNVDAAVGTTVQNMQQNGEYRCKVDKQKALDDAFVQWTACSVIEMIDGAAAYDLGKACKHGDNYVDVEVNNTAALVTFVNSDPYNDNKPDNKTIEIGNLTVTEDAVGLDIDYVNKVGSTEGKRTLKVNGDMTVNSPTDIIDSQKIEITGNLDIESVDGLGGVSLYYAGGNKNEGGLVVGENITVTDAQFNASDQDALKIECTNFSLIKKAKTGAPAAYFGLRSAGNDTKTMTVKGTISNPKDCTFQMQPVGGGTDLLAWITCYSLTTGGAFPGGKPTVVAAE